MIKIKNVIIKMIKIFCILGIFSLYSCTSLQKISTIQKINIAKNIQCIKTEIGKECTIEYEIFKITAYNLSYQSCEKSPSHSGFGITRYGIDLKGKNYKTARIVAFDPKLGLKPLSKVRLIFDGKYKKYNGIYTLGDIGGGVKGKHFDFFLNSDYNSNKKAMDFGITYAKVEILK